MEGAWWMAAQDAAARLVAWLAGSVTPARLLVALLLWSALSVLLVGGLGAWIATRRVRRHRR
jgi:nitrate reductase NapE component